MRKFGLINEINPQEPCTWKGRYFLTFDIDWAHDEVLKDTLELVEGSGVPATFFITHKTKLVERIKHSNSLEIGIHPNFNFLLKGSHLKGKNIDEVIENVLCLAPESKSVRSHSIVQSGPISEAFLKKGITHESNDFIPEYAKISLKPWSSNNGLVKVPYCWADEYAWKGQLDCDFNNFSKRTGLTVLDFHPIHIFLNSNSTEIYESTRSFHDNPDYLIKKRFKGYGTRTRLIELLELG
jgi:hypothetical protein